MGTESERHLEPKDAATADGDATIVFGEFEPTTVLPINTLDDFAEKIEARLAQLVANGVTREDIRELKGTICASLVALRNREDENGDPLEIPGLNMERQDAAMRLCVKLYADATKGAPPVQQPGALREAGMTTAPAGLGAIISITTEADFVAFETRLSCAFSIEDRHAKGREQALLSASLQSYLLRIERGEDPVVNLERLHQAAGMINNLLEQVHGEHFERMQSGDE